MTAHVFISGFVQGVGFRRFIRAKAREFGLCGFVRNLPDNRVEAMLQGPKEVVDKMVEQIRKGPFLSEVKDISVDWQDQPEEMFASFEIR